MSYKPKSLHNRIESLFISSKNIAYLKKITGLTSIDYRAFISTYLYMVEGHLTDEENLNKLNKIFTKLVLGTEKNTKFDSFEDDILDLYLHSDNVKYLLTFMPKYYKDQAQFTHKIFDFARNARELLESIGRKKTDPYYYLREINRSFVKSITPEASSTGGQYYNDRVFEQTCLYPEGYESLNKDLYQQTQYDPYYEETGSIKPTLQDAFDKRDDLDHPIRKERIMRYQTIP